MATNTSTATTNTTQTKARTPKAKAQTTTRTDRPTAQTDSTQAKTFDTIKRTFEIAYASGDDYTAPLYDLATAVAYSVINRCIDPQRKAAAERETVSNSGHNPALIELKTGIGHDRRTLDKTRYCVENATRTTYNANGDRVTETIDKEAAAALVALVSEQLTEGIDLVQTAALALLEQAAEHAAAPEWLDSRYTVRRLSRRVYIQHSDSAAYKDIDTTPIQEVYRTVRKAIQASRATATDPRNGYSYIEELTADGLDTIYYRLHKYADLGGYNADGQYTTDRQNVMDYETTIEKLQLTDRQAQILRLRMQGKGYKAIATYLGVTQRAIAKTVAQIQTKAAAIGLTPAGYTAE